jgi:Zn-dependent protease
MPYLLIALSTYFVLTHSTALVYRMPRSQTTYLAFGVSLFLDLSTHAGLFLYARHVAPTSPVQWVFLAELAVHAVHANAFFLLPRLYTRVHDYRRPGLFEDGLWVGPKLVLALIDTLVYGLGVMILLKTASEPIGPALSAAAAGAAYGWLFWTRDRAVSERSVPRP